MTNNLVQTIDGVFDSIILSRFKEKFGSYEPNEDFGNCVKSMTKGPFGSDIKKSLFVPKSKDTYKVYIQANAIQKDQTLGDYHISKEYYDEKMHRFSVEPGDYLITCDGTMGKWVRLDSDMEKGIISASLLRITINDEKMSPGYFESLWEYDMLPYLLSQVRNGCLKHLPSATVIGSLKVVCPLKDEQDDFSQFKEQVNKARAICKELVSKYDDLVKSRFIEMFGNFVSGECKFVMAPLQSVCKSIVRGPFGSALKKEFFVPKSENSVKIYEQKHAIQKDWTLGTYYITPEKANELSRFECHPGDFIMSCSGTMGEIYQLPEDAESGVINQALCKFTLSDKMLPSFFSITMSMAIHNLSSHGSAIANIAAVKYVKEMRIPCPPIEEQIKFSLFKEQVDKSKSILMNSIVTKTLQGSCIN